MLNISDRSITIGLIAGEHSGDILGSGLMNALRKYLPNVQFFGVSGPRMKEAGMESWYNIEDIEVMGIFEVIKYLPKILRIRRELVKRFITLNPDVFVGIDSPDFLSTIENQLKNHGIRTVHYVSPSIWAWRKYRIHKIKRSVDNMLVLMPFEKKIYDHYHIPCKFVGHTLADRIPINPDKISARLELGISVNTRCLLILPGSRENEIAMLSEIFLLSAKYVKQYFLELEIIVQTTNSYRRTQFEKIKSKIAPELSLKIFDSNNTHQSMIAADVALVASGTATLECMLAKCPMIVAYRVNFLTFILSRFLVKTPWISIPNLLANKKLVKEFLQKDCNATVLAKHLIELFKDNDQRSKMIVEFLDLHNKIRCKADDQAANAIIALINSNS